MEGEDHVKAVWAPSWRKRGSVVVPASTSLQTHGFLSARVLTREALEFAAAAHGEQRRAGDHAPYIVHPLEVAALLAAHGFDDAVTAAAILHDTLEQTDATSQAIRERFGDRVADMVSTMTEDGSIPAEDQRRRDLRWRMTCANREVAAIFAADKLSKAREWRIRVSHDPCYAQDSEGRSKLNHYRQSAAVLDARLGRHPLVTQLHFELESLQSLPPRGVRVAA
jgi:(p)ppGpp synthase/HD superfamily hydrolase